MKKSIKVNDNVMFSKDVVRRCGHSKDVADMRGRVTEITDRVATVDTSGTYPNSEGNSIRSIPVANLVLVSGIELP